MKSSVHVFCKHSKMVPVADLVPHPLNPNTHPPGQVEKLAKLIRSHGWRKPITVSNRSGYIVRGHGRLMAARHAGIIDAPVDYQDYVSDDQELADLVADNKVSEYSYLDESLAGDISAILGESGFDLELAGFDIDAMNEDEEEKNRGKNKVQDKLQLPYIFTKQERDDIMHVLSGADDMAAELVRVCVKAAENL